jgi:phosphoribosylanthranilate isomerase
MTAVKICGLTNAEDAGWAWRCGADLLGFICVPSSPRDVPPERVQEMARNLRADGCQALLVGVFAETRPQVIRETALRCGLDLVQLHGYEDAPFPLADLGLPAIVARRVRERLDWGAWRLPGAWATLLDRYDSARLGGSGEAWDWALYEGSPPDVSRLILAGGLTAENVAAAIAAVRPWGVDVSSGVEAVPGRKDWHKVARFIQQARKVTI